jgi:hypothetical protein
VFGWIDAKMKKMLADARAERTSPEEPKRVLITVVATLE